MRWSCVSVIACNDVNGAVPLWSWQCCRGGRTTAMTVRAGSRSRVRASAMAASFGVVRRWNFGTRERIGPPGLIQWPDPEASLEPHFQKHISQRPSHVLPSCSFQQCILKPPDCEYISAELLLLQPFDFPKFNAKQPVHTSPPKKMRILRGLPDQHLHQQFFRVFVHPSLSPYETLRRAGIRLRPGVQLANFLNFVPLALRCRTTIG